MRPLSFLCGLMLLAALGSAGADVLDDTTAAQSTLDDLALATVGSQWQPGTWEAATDALQTFSQTLSTDEARDLWLAALATPAPDSPSAAAAVGTLQATLQQVIALEMLGAYARDDRDATREWRAAMKLPKHASAVEGLLALQRMNGNAGQREQVARMLARETLVWQGSRARERSDELLRLARAGRSTEALVALRSAEIDTLTAFPAGLLAAAHVEPLPQTTTDLPANSVEALAAWKSSVESRLPDLLTPEEVERQERLVLKLLRLIPMEYRAGVRDGEVVIPIEYREAVTFTVQAQQLLVEVRPNWLKNKSEALTAYGDSLETQFADLEAAIAARVDSTVVEDACTALSTLLADHFGVTLRKSGKGADIVQESALEVRELLGQSLSAARASRWREAEALRLEAYTTFDLEIEARVLPRDPNLAVQAERSFLDGSAETPGIKAALDRRAKDPELSAAYEQTLSEMDECVALLRVGLSPTTVSITAFTIVLREGLEAVVILAALLAGLRGPENAASRRQIGIGAWGAIAVSALTFILARNVIQSLSRYGETLEAVISVLAVIILLIVTNWVFHKYYWTGWNARLRELKDKATTQRGQRWEAMAMCGVGFLTIYREGFETTLFMQSLILEGGFQASLIGLFAGLSVIALAGWAIFSLGMKLPYRKLLVITGFLIVTILATFLGSTVRIFQTIGWLPIHPIYGVEIPTWMGTWLGIYPSWEGLLIPMLGFAYVGGAWLWVRWQGRRNAHRLEQATSATAVKRQPARA